MDRPDLFEIYSMNTKSTIYAVVVSVLVSIPVLLASVTIPQGTIWDVLAHPLLRAVLAKQLFWFFLTGFLSSIITIVVLKKLER